MTDTVVDDGQVAVGAVLSSGDTQTVQSAQGNILVGGRAFDTTVNGGAKQILNYGTAIHTTVNAQGEQDVQLGGIATDTVLAGNLSDYAFHLFNDGRQVIYQGIANRTIVGSGGNQAIAGTSAHSGVANEAIIQSGGYQSVGPYGVANGTIIQAGGAQWAGDYGAGPAFVSNTVIQSGGTQILYNATETGDILQIGGTIIVGNINYVYYDNDNAYVTTAKFDQSTGSLTLSNAHYMGGSISQSINLAGDYSGFTFSVGPAPLTNATSITLLCFCRGTSIRTPAGDVPVEQLLVGDLVITAKGRTRPVRWIGSRAAIVDKANSPIVVREKAFSECCPDRDLRITAGHSILFGDVLIPIGLLENGRTIYRDSGARAVEVFHIELDRHDIVFANGALAESYRDDGNRIGFTSSTGETNSRRSTPSCAPIVTRGPIIERTRRRLAERCAMLTTPEGVANAERRRL